jgi:MoaA/NifB/PqqE/SkfB family radical SAM enzyme
MEDVYATTLRFFIRKAAREFRPAWLRAAPNLVLHAGIRRLEEWRLVAPLLRHRWLRPISVGLQLTRHCNYRCTFCTVNDLVADGDGTTALTLDEFRSLLRQPLLSRCARLSLTGGEPLLAADFFAIVREAKRFVPIVTVNTNFSLVKKSLDALNTCGLDMINVSLYEPNELLVRRFAPKLSRNMYRRLSFVVNERDGFHHFGRIPIVAQLAVDLGFQALYLQNYLPASTLDHGSLRAANGQSLEPVERRNPQFAALREEIQNRFRGRLAIAWPAFAEAEAGTEARPRCRQPDTQILIDRDGALAPCCILDPDTRFGSAFKPENWNSPAFVEIRRGLKQFGAPLSPACHSCPFVYRDMFNA